MGLKIIIIIIIIIIMIIRKSRRFNATLLHESFADENRSDD